MITNGNPKCELDDAGTLNIDTETLTRWRTPCYRFRNSNCRDRDSETYRHMMVPNYMKKIQQCMEGWKDGCMERERERERDIHSPWLLLLKLRYSFVPGRETESTLSLSLSLSLSGCHFRASRRTMLQISRPQPLTQRHMYKIYLWALVWYVALTLSSSPALPFRQFWANQHGHSRADLTEVFKRKGPAKQKGMDGGEFLDSWLFAVHAQFHSFSGTTCFPWKTTA